MFDFLEAAFRKVIVVFMFMILFVTSYQVVLRYFFNNSTSWSDFIASALFVWITLIGAAIAIRTEKNMCIKFVANSRKLNEKLKIFLDIFAYIMTMVFLLYFTASGYLLIKTEWHSVPGEIGIGYGYLYSVTFISGLISIIFLSEKIVKRYRKERRA